jgi:hypothetical protein
VGRLVSLPRALVGGVGLGIAISLINTFLPRWSETHTWLQPLQDNLTPAIPFVVLFGVLVLVPSIRRDREAGDPLSWTSTRACRTPRSGTRGAIRCPLLHPPGTIEGPGQWC